MRCTGFQRAHSTALIETGAESRHYSPGGIFTTPEGEGQKGVSGENCISGPLKKRKCL